MKIASLTSIQISFELSIDARVLLNSHRDSMRNSNWLQVIAFKMLEELVEEAA